MEHLNDATLPFAVVYRTVIDASLLGYRLFREKVLEGAHIHLNPWREGELQFALLVCMTKDCHVEGRAVAPDELRLGFPGCDELAELDQRCLEVYWFGIEQSSDCFFRLTLPERHGALAEGTMLQRLFEIDVDVEGSVLNQQTVWVKDHGSDADHRCGVLGVQGLDVYHEMSRAHSSPRVAVCFAASDSRDSVVGYHPSWGMPSGIPLRPLPVPHRAESSELSGVAPARVCFRACRQDTLWALTPLVPPIACAHAYPKGGAIGCLSLCHLSSALHRVGFPHWPALWCPELPLSQSP